MSGVLSAEPAPSALELAARLAAQAGLAQPRSATRLTGGKNNRVFRIDDGLVLKLYHADPRDPRDRLRAEWGFLTYAWSRGVRNIPQPLAKDDAAHAGLYTLLPGRVLEPRELATRHVDAALEFLLAVNAAPREPLALDPGSEACFSLNEHIATIERRVTRLQTVDPDVPQREAAQALIEARLHPIWMRVKAAILDGAARLGIDPAQRLDTAELCLSPSDFGFHNALIDGPHVGFIDFEYAGRDDVAKLVCDFFCQPEVPVPIAHMPDFTRRLVSGLGLAPAHDGRCSLLLDAYRIKWTCIILNDFLPLGAARRAYADLARNEQRSTFQLARAGAKLDEIALS